MTDAPTARFQNVHGATVEGSGREWSTFSQGELDGKAAKNIFNDYFALFPWSALPEAAVGADIGCGSGRWAVQVAPRVEKLLVLDASEQALNVARANLAAVNNVAFHHASVGSLPFENESLDFAYSLGVLHHVPDTARAIREIATKLKPGAPFLVYLYYAFDNRPLWFKWLWRTSDLARRVVSRTPYMIRYLVSQAIAVTVYLPLARMARALNRVGTLPSAWPLSYYRDKPFYVMRTDAMDRFGTQLEQRFTRADIQRMLEGAGLEGIRFSDRPPFWVAIGFKDLDSATR